MTSRQSGGWSCTPIALPRSRQSKSKPGAVVQPSVGVRRSAGAGRTSRDGWAGCWVGGRAPSAAGQSRRSEGDQLEELTIPIRHRSPTARKILNRLPLVKWRESSFERYALETGEGHAATSAERPGFDLVPFVAMARLQA